MPCKDITEMLTLELDDTDVLVAYRFVKRTCGKGVGADSLLENQLCGLTVDDILAITPEAFLEAYPVEEEIEEFLGLKHLIAVQSVLEVLTGRTAGGPGEICAAAEICYEDGRTTIDARILVDLVTEKIKSCGGCRSCGTKKKSKVEAVVGAHGV